MAKVDHSAGTKRSAVYSTRVLNRIRLSEETYEIELVRPVDFSFVPGQRIRILSGSLEKDYSLVSTPKDPFLKLCVHRVPRGAFSPLLTEAAIDTPFEFSGPHGFFVHRKTARPVVFVSTGTGIAPFVSMAASGLAGFTMLHGARTVEELYYAPLFSTRARKYVPCLSGDPGQPYCEKGFSGKVTDYIEDHLSPLVYDFYLCGRSDMIRDVILIVDEKFQGSYVYTEIYY